MTIRLIADLTLVEIDQPRAGRIPAALNEQVARAIQAGSAHVVVAIAGCDECIEPDVDAIIAARKSLLHHGGDMRIVASPAYAQHVSRRLGGWSPVSASVPEAVSALSPAPNWPHTRMVGYWSLRGERSIYPDPHRLVAPDWRPEQRRQIVRYLRAAPTMTIAMGSSPCRFGCGPNGAGEQSDGTWHWPEGLAHYVKAHHVRLPEEFVRTMEQNAWAAPEGKEWHEKNPEFWIEWSARQGLIAAEYGQCLACVARVRAALEGSNIDRLWNVSPQDGRSLRALIQLVPRLGWTDPTEIAARMAEWLPAVERLCAEAPA